MHERERRDVGKRTGMYERQREEGCRRKNRRDVVDRRGGM